MKTKRMCFSMLGIVLIFAALSLSSCKKQDTTTSNQNQSMIDQELTQSEHILNFKEKLSRYHNNPNLKASGEGYFASEALTELENLLNFNFCDASAECNKSSFMTTEVIMPLDDLSKIHDLRLSQLYYEEIIDSIQAMMGRLNYPNMKLLVVDLDQTGSATNGDAIISVGALIGNAQNVVLNNDNWWYGENYGTCDGTYAPEDAASQLAERVTNAVVPAPPTGCRWYFTGPILHTTILPTQDQVSTVDNYLDYKIFYASEVVAPITDTEKCLSQYEMSFYEGHYINYALNYQTATGKKFSRCTIVGKPYYSPFYHIQHDYTIFVGNRFLECTDTIDDILEY
jgi:hypothetical protein